jgi:hypothetical protein
MNKFLAEQWKGIEGYPDYEVSSHGRIRKVSTGRLVACYKDEDRRRCTLGSTNYFYVSNLVAAGFLGPRPEGCEVHHIDKDKTNDWAYNLEYVVIRVHRMKHRKKLTLDEVRQIKIACDTGEDRAQIAERFKVSRSYVGNIACGARGVML